MKRLQFWISVVLAVHVAVFVFVLMDSLQRSTMQRPISVFLVKHRVRLKRHSAMLEQDIALPAMDFEHSYAEDEDSYQRTSIRPQVNTGLSVIPAHRQQYLDREATDRLRVDPEPGNHNTMRHKKSLSTPIRSTNHSADSFERPVLHSTVVQTKGALDLKPRNRRIPVDIDRKVSLPKDTPSHNVSGRVARSSRKARTSTSRSLVMAACLLVDDLLASKKSLESGILKRFAIRTTTYEYTKHVFRLYISYVSPRHLNLSFVKFAAPTWLDIIPVRSHTRKGEAYRVNKVMQRAYDEGAHALVRVFPWTEFYLRPWFSRKMNLLRHTYPSYTGIILSFPRRISSKTSEFRFNYIFTTRTHLEIFDSFLPMALSPQESDIWLASIYPSTFMSRGSSRQWANFSSISAASDGSLRPRAVRIFTRDGSKVRTYAALAQLKKYGFKKVNSSHHEAWKQLQRNFLRKIGRATKKNKDFKARMRLLIVRSVSNEPSSVEHFAQWAQELGKAHDTIHFALNHYQNNQSNWAQVKEIYGHMIVMERMGIRCKVGFWKEIDPKFAASYDYLWLVDDDLGLEFFDWKLTRFLLQNLNPMVAQPCKFLQHRSAITQSFYSIP